MRICLKLHRFGPVFRVRHAVPVRNGLRARPAAGAMHPDARPRVVRFLSDIRSGEDLSVSS